MCSKGKAEDGADDIAKARQEKKEQEKKEQDEAEDGVKARQEKKEQDEAEDGVRARQKKERRWSRRRSKSEAGEEGTKIMRIFHFFLIFLTEYLHLFKFS